MSNFSDRYSDVPIAEKRVMMPPPSGSPRRVGQVEKIESEIRASCNSLIDSVNLLRDRLSSVLLSRPVSTGVSEMLKEEQMCAVATALSSDLALIHQADAMIHSIIGDLEL